MLDTSNMSSSAVSAATPFGRVLTAMVTPFDAHGELDLDGTARLAVELMDAGHDGLVLNGTTGESPTTTDSEKERVVRAVVEAVGDRAVIVAGVGTNDTRHTVELARAAEKAGAHGLLVVTPYYNKPPQEGLYEHFRTVADSTGLPVMLYDIPARSGVPIAGETLIRLAHHDRIVAVKDAKDDLGASSVVLAATDLAYYSGSDMFNLPLLSIGAVGFVSVVGHLVGPRLRRLVEAYTSGATVEATALHRELLPVYEGIFRTQGTILVKAALALQGRPGGGVRLPLVPATPAQIEQLRMDLVAGGVPLGSG
jgi:4-hydroxy-tetrahydrodipicolinate synthase